MSFALRPLRVRNRIIPHCSIRHSQQQTSKKKKVQICPDMLVWELC
jgi:hypothetical protein